MVRNARPRAAGPWPTISGSGKGRAPIASGWYRHWHRPDGEAWAGPTFRVQPECVTSWATLGAKGGRGRGRGNSALAASLGPALRHGIANCQCKPGATGSMIADCQCRRSPVAASVPGAARSVRRIHRGNAMHLDLDAYIALGFLVATVVVTIGLFAFLLLRRKN